MTHKYREKTPTGYLCTKYGCKFSSADVCKKRAENNLDDTCQACTGLTTVKTAKHSSIHLGTRSMRSKKAA